MNNKTIIYINFSPYENTGNILDFLLENFENVLMFSLRFHLLGKNSKSSRLRIYKKGKFIKENKLFRLPIPKNMVFLLLPIRSFLIFLQILWHTYRLKKVYKNYDIYFTVNAFTAWIGNVLRMLKIVDKTIFWVWDYYPPMHENKIIMLMRGLYWQFDKAGTRSDRVVFLNKRLENLRKEIGLLPKSINYPIIPIGTNPVSQFRKKKIEEQITLVFLGVLKKSQGLDLIFDHANLITKTFPSVKIEIVGSGPDEKYFKELAKKCKINIKFHGFLPSQMEVNKVLERAQVGLALYIPQESNVSYFGDPSKIKSYLSFGIPVITTNVFIFSHEIVKEKAGIVIKYGSSRQFIGALLTILKNYDEFQRNAYNLANKYYYKKIYPELFKFKSEEVSK